MNKYIKKLMEEIAHTEKFKGVDATANMIIGRIEGLQYAIDLINKEGENEEKTTDIYVVYYQFGFTISITLFYDISEADKYVSRIKKQMLFKTEPTTVNGFFEESISIKKMTITKSIDEVEE
jgi:hypothetical protein